MLEKVRYADPEEGIHTEAYTDGYAYDENLRVYLLSLSGRESTVKSVSAAVTSGYPVEIVSKSVVPVMRAHEDEYRSVSAKLPSGLVHRAMFSERFSNNGEAGNPLVYVPDDVAAWDAVYEAVKERHAVPLIPEWSRWLYDRMLSRGLLKELSGSRKVLEVRAGERDVDELVSEGVKLGEIEF